MSEDTTVAEPETQAPPAEPAAPPEPPPPSAEEQLAAVRAELDTARRQLAEKSENEAELRESRAKVKRLESRMLETKQVASDAKKAYESAMTEHLELEETLDSGQARLPFADPPADPPKIAGTAEADDAWRGARLRDLVDQQGNGLASGMLEALAEAEIHTMGDVSDWTGPPPKGKNKRLTDVKGIGEGKAARIEEVLLHFWGSRQVVALEESIAQAVRETEAEQVPPAQAWRIRPLAALGLPAPLVDALERYGYHHVQDVAAAVYSDFLATVPGLEDPANRTHVQSVLDEFRAALPDDQAFDIAEFEAERVPPKPATRKSAKPKNAAPVS